MKYLYKSTALLIIFTLFSIMSLQPVATANDVIPIKKIGEVEEILYGEKSSSSIIERIAAIEETLYGKTKDDSLVERAENVADYVLSQGSTPSLPFVLNSLEWTLANNITDGDIVSRLKELETNIFGKAATGPVIPRIEKLANMSFPEGRINGNEINLTENKEIRIRFIEKVDSTTIQEGEIVTFEVADDVIIDNHLLIPEGSKGKMRVESVEEIGQFGKDGQVKMNILPIRAVDGTKIELQLPESDFMDKRSRQLAVGAGLLGAIVVGNPLGFALGYFVKGNPESHDAGEVISLNVKGDYNIFALQIN